MSHRIFGLMNKFVCQCSQRCMENRYNRSLTQENVSTAQNFTVVKNFDMCFIVYEVI